MRPIERLQATLEGELKGYNLIVVSDMEPYIHSHDWDGIKCRSSAGGLSVALDPIMRLCHGTWIAYGSGNADAEAVDANDKVLVPPTNHQYTLRRIWLSKEEVDGYHTGFSNQSMWPLCHYAFVRPDFDPKNWECYKQINARFARAAIEEEKEQEQRSVLWSHDYQLALLPKMIKDEIDIPVVHFWHIPWPTSDLFAMCPWKREILEGLLGSDLIGFHTKRYCMHFLHTVGRYLGARIDETGMTASYDGHTTLVRAHPISVDYEELHCTSTCRSVSKEIHRWKRRYPQSYISVGVGRIDYTKGLIEKVKAIDWFLEKYPEYQGNFVHIEAGVLDRLRVKAYTELDDVVDEMVDQINWKYHSGRWDPIVYVKEKLELPKLLALYNIANLCIVSSTHDGLNIVSKEFIASRRNSSGVLLLSKFTGACQELREAVGFNPYDRDGFADAIKKGLEMPPEEATKRMRALRRRVKKNDIYEWVYRIVSDVVEMLQTTHGDQTDRSK